MDTFKARPFLFPEDTAKAICEAGRQFKDVFNAHKASLGLDLEIIQQWNKWLEKHYNWGGGLVQFLYVADAYAREHNLSPSHIRQVMFETDSGRAAAYTRFRHMQRDSASRPKDATVIEETLLSPEFGLRDLSLSRAMYDYICHEAEGFGKKRIMTEILVGLKPSQYGGLARNIKSLERKPKRSCAEEQALHHAKLKFNKDWLDATLRFVDAMGFEITDASIPNDPKDRQKQPQIRITKIIDNTAQALPPMLSKDRDYVTLDQDPKLERIGDWLDMQKNFAFQRYNL